jgi:hypothetical protein
VYSDVNNLHDLPEFDLQDLYSYGEADLARKLLDAPKATIEAGLRHYWDDKEGHTPGSPAS